MRILYTACAVLMALLLTPSATLAQSSPSQSWQFLATSSLHLSTTGHAPRTALPRRITDGDRSASATQQAITLTAGEPYYYGTTFRTDAVSSAWSSRILTGVRMDDAIRGDQWVYPELVRRDGQVSVRVQLSGTTADGGEQDVRLGQEYRLIIRGVWNGFFTVSYSWTLAATGEEADNDWVPIGSHFVWGAPTLSYLYKNESSDNDYSGELLSALVSKVYRDVVPAPVNQAPTLAAIPEVRLRAGSSTIVTLRAEDADAADVLSFSATSTLPPFVTLTDNGDRSATLQLLPGLDEVGTYTATLSVSDGELSAEQPLRIVVAPAPLLSFGVDTLSFVATADSAVAPQSVTLGSSDDSSPAVTLSDDPHSGEWLVLPMGTGTGNLSFGLKAGLATGTYSTTLIATASGYRSAELYVEATVNAAAPPTVELPRIVSIFPPDGATGVPPTTEVATERLLLPNGLNGVFGVDNSTVNNQTVRLFKQATGALVPSSTNGTGGGDAFSLSPTFPLEANTTYRFEMDGVRDLTGAAFAPFSSTFTTATASNNGNGNGNLDAVSFTNRGNVATDALYTSLAIGPDRRLYGLTIAGNIHRWSIAEDGALTGKFTITTLTDTYGDRSAVGLTFSPDATAEDPVVYVSHASGGLSNAPAWDGKISELSGADLSVEHLIVTNLPRSRRDHLTNGIAFRPGEPRVLYFNQGSNTAGGAPDNSWGNRRERLLAAATLRLDLDRLPRSQWPLNAKTTMDPSAINAADPNSPTLGSGTGTYQENGQSFPDDGTYNPYYKGAPLTLFATGVRNAYDLAWHSNGQLYVPTNGTAGGSNSPASVEGTRRPDGSFYTLANPNFPAVPATNNNETQRDWLFRIDPNAPLGYYGHPNPLRGEFVLNRGPVDVANYPATVLPDVNYRGAAYDFEKNKSPNGVIEYRSNAENGNLRGALLVCRYSGGSDIIALVPGGADGDIVTAKTGIPGFGGFRDPLDIVEDVTNGNLYVSDFGRQTIVLLQPGNRALPRPLITLSPEEVLADEVVNAAAGKRTTVFVVNGGNAALEDATATLSGPDAGEFTLDAAALPTRLYQNSGSVVVTFTPTSAGPKFATLTVSGNNGEPASVPLRGLGKNSSGGSKEPSLQHIFDTYGIDLSVGDTDPVTSQIDLPQSKSYSDLLGDEVGLQQFQRATNGLVTVEVLAVFGPDAANPVLEFGWYPSGDPGGRSSTFSVLNTPVGNAQTLTPRITGSLAFNPGQTTFGFYSRWPYFNDRTVYGEDALNDFSGALPHHLRVYELPNEDNAYVIAFEEHVSGFDYQDLVVIVRNVAPAGSARIAASPEELLFETTANNQGPRTQTRTLTIANSGRGELTVSDIRLRGPFADRYSVAGPVPVNLAPAAAQEYTVTFAPAANGGELGYQEAALVFATNVEGQSDFTVGLHGLHKAGLEGSKEPPLQAVVNTLGIGIDVGWTTLANHTDAVPEGEEVIAPLFEAAGSGAVGIVSVARYSPAEVLPFGWYTYADGAPDRREVGVQGGSLANAQTLYPSLESGGERFDPAGATFGIFVESKAFGRFNYTEDALNVGVAHRTRVYPVRDRAGKLIEHSYLVCFEDATNGDYQDYVFLLTNVRPAGAGSQVLSFAPSSIEIAAPRGRVSGTARAELRTSMPLPAAGVRLSASAPWVVLPQMVSTDEPLPIAVNAFALGDGSYRATVTATAPGFAPATLEVTAVVTENVLFAERINFQDGSFSAPSGYLADVGAAYGVRAEGRVFGWIDAESGEPADNTVSARGRGRGVREESTDEFKLLNSFNTFDDYNLRPRVRNDWEIAVPNGSYRVEVAAGDPKTDNSRHYIRAEGVTLIEDFVSSPGEVRRVSSGIVRVVDGKLTLDDVGAGPDDYTKIVYVTLTQVPENRVPPTLTAAVEGYRDAAGAYRGEARVVLSATDYLGGDVASITYRLDDGNVLPYRNAIALAPTNGRQRQEYRVSALATDSNGNTTTEEITLTVVRGSGAVVRVENMNKIPGTDRGFPADDFFSFHRSDVATTRDGQPHGFHDTNVLRLHNEGNAPLIVTRLTTSDTTAFAVADLVVPEEGLVIAPASFIDVTLRFVATRREDKIEMITAELVLGSNADNAAAVAVTLRGGYQKFMAGNNEINTQQVFENLGFRTSMARENGRYITSPSSDYPTAARVDAGAEGDLILSEYFVQADPSRPVQIMQVAALHGNGGAPTQLRNRADRTVSGMSHNHGGLWFNTLFPRLTDDSPIIANKQAATIGEEFQIVIAGYRSSGGNTRNQLKDRILGVRVYKVIDRQGRVIPNEYLVLQDYIGNGCAQGSGNCDWQDNAAYLTNARPVAVPTATAVADREVVAAQTDRYDVSGSFDKGYAGNRLTYTATLSGGEPLPVWISLDADRGRFTTNAPYPAAGGRYGVRVTATDLNGLSASTTFELRVAESGQPCTAEANADGQPKVIYCQGGSVRLSGHTSSGIYKWTGPNGFTSTDRHPVVTEAGVYTLTSELLLFGACASSSSVTVTENFSGAPTLSIDAPTLTLSCGTPAIQLSAVTDVVDPSYAWYLGDRLIGSAGRLSVRRPGTYRLAVRGSDGCASTRSVVVGEDLSPLSPGSGGSVTVCELSGPVSLFQQLRSLGGNPQAGGRWTLLGQPVDDRFDPATASGGIYTYTVGDGSTCVPVSAELTVTVTPAQLYYRDRDGDGFGAMGSGELLCGDTDGYVSNDRDCDDTDGDVHPGAAERCDGLDNDCDADVDEGDACAAPATAIRINAGGPEVSFGGKLFAADRYFRDGNAYTNARVALPTIYQTERTAGNPYLLRYEVPVPDGRYTVRLHFAEIYWGAPGGGTGGVGKRLFDIRLEDRLLEDNLDLTAEVGAAGALVREYRVDVSDGKLDLLMDARSASGGRDQPKLSALEIISQGSTAANTPPVAVATATPTSGISPLSVNLDGTASYDVDGSLATYAWSWNGGTATGPSARVTFLEGNYRVALTVTDHLGLSATDTVAITVGRNIIDTDGDGIEDAVDNCPSLPNADQQLPIWYADTDGDGYGDPADTVRTCSAPEGFVANRLDNCPTVNSADLTDTDGDGVGDACDDDDDNDGIRDTDDCAPLDATTGSRRLYYADADADGYGDPNQAKLACSQPAGYVTDNTDNCPSVANPDQSDADGDGRGDACGSAAPLTKTTFWLEAECAQVGGVWAVGQDPTASGGNYVDAPGKYDLANVPADLPANRVRFTFDRAEAGTYNLFARISGANGDADSYWVRVNGGSWIKWSGGITADGTFHWNKLRQTLPLMAGANSIDFAWREGGARLDKLHLNRDGAQPVGLGEQATNCGADRNKLPVARATASVTEGAAPLSVRLDASGSYDTDGRIASYVWKWRGGFVTGPTPTVIFPTGSYTVTLTVIDDRGGAATTSLSVRALDDRGDTDGDGIPNGTDNCPTVYNPAQLLTTYYADEDGDGLGDPSRYVQDCEQPNGYVSNADDNCPTVKSTDRTDSDGDGLGDGCDPDDDNDGIADSEDCAPLDPNTGAGMLYYLDTDGDGFGDPAQSVRACTQPTGYVTDRTDNCPRTANPDQTDTDGDGVGDACEGVVYLRSSFWLEAECAVVGANWRQGNDTGASENGFVSAPGQRSMKQAPADLAANYVRFILADVAAGDYHVFGRIAAANPDSDSYWVRANGGGWIRWSGGIIVDGSFHWNKLRNVTLRLDEGVNVVDFAYREGDARLDKLHLATVDALPTGTGTPADNCGAAVNLPPVARAGASVREGAGPLTVQLTASGSYDADGTIASYQWQWTGGSAQGAAPTVTLPIGTYAVTLRVTDNAGATAEDAISITAFDPGLDKDGDGVADAVDNCPTVANSDQRLPLFYADFDGDGYGDPADTVRACTQPIDYVANGLDNCPAIYSLDISDSDGDSIGDACDVVVGTSSDHSLEAECATVGSGWEVRSDAAASRGAYVSYVGGNNFAMPSGSNPAKEIGFTVEVSAAATYYLFLRLDAPDPARNSLWVRVDGGNWMKLWKEADGKQLLTQGFEWRRVTDDAREVSFDLTPGTHNVTVAHREAGTLVDKVFLSTARDLPVGLGTAATNCGAASTLGTAALMQQTAAIAPTALTQGSLYPNPTTDRLNVAWEGQHRGAVTLVITDFTGRQLRKLTVDKQAERWQATLDVSELPSGTYRLQLIEADRQSSHAFVKMR